MNKKVLVAVAWPYVNGNIHLGHPAGYLLPADITARYNRLVGNDVLMVSGSDCHGTPITIEADKTDMTPQEVVDLYHKKDIELFKKYNLSYNLYTKTTTETHKQVTHEIFLNLLKNGFIIKKTEKQYYSEEDDKFLPDRYVEGTCPFCGSQDQRGDQCESCGRMIDQGTLIDPVSKLTGNKVELKDTEHYYLDLSNLEDKVNSFVEEEGANWREWVLAETKGWLKDGLHARAITRDIDWGIEIPKEEIERLDPEMVIGNIENKRFYVWFEAVIGYYSASRAFFEADDADVIKNEFKGQSQDFNDWWSKSQAKEKGFGQEHFYFMGQDNVVFHSIMWPAQLLGSYGDDIKLADNVAANKFMNFKGRKFSKSRGWIVDSHEVADQFGVDAVRFYLSSNFPENKESNFTWEEFVDSINNELVANLGNFINRVLVFSNKNFEEIKGFVNSEVQQEVESTIKEFNYHMKKIELVKGIQTVMRLSSFGNKYFNDSEVWKVIKEDKEKAQEILFNCLYILEILSILIEPFMPDSSVRLREMLGLMKIEVEVNTNFIQTPNSSTYKINEPEVLFQKIDREVVLKEKNAE